MGRKRMKGCKYQRVSQQQKYIFLKLCITEQQSIHEVSISLFRPPFTQAFNTPQPKQSSSFTKKITKITPPTMFPTLDNCRPLLLSKPHGKPSQLIWKDSPLNASP